MTPKRLVFDAMAIVITDDGGFPVNNIAYWKMSSQYKANAEPILVVWFKTGGFLEIPGMSPAQFSSLLQGSPY